MSITILAVTVFSRLHGEMVLVKDQMLWSSMPHIPGIVPRSFIVMDRASYYAFEREPLEGIIPFVSLQEGERLRTQSKFVHTLSNCSDLQEISKRKPFFLVGGRSFYEQFIDSPEVSMLHIIHTHLPNHKGDERFPEFSREKWELSRHASHAKGTTDYWVRK